MALNAPGLAEEMRTALVFPSPTSIQLTAFATGIVEEVQAATAGARNIPGPHSISGMTGASMAARIVAAGGYPYISPQLNLYCSAIVSHIQGAGQVFYTSPIPANPPPPSDSWFLGGTITGLDGTILAALIASTVGYPYVSTRLLAKSTAITDHIQANAEVTDGVIA